MANTTLVALFKEKRDAEAAVRALTSAQFDSARLGVVGPGKAHVQAFGKMALAGVGAGTVVCGILGVGLGLAMAGLLPGMHAWLPGGWFVPLMFGLTAAAAGALAGMLISQSVSRQDALYYEEEVEAGRTLVTVISEAAHQLGAACTPLICVEGRPSLAALRLIDHLRGTGAILR